MPHKTSQICRHTVDRSVDEYGQEGGVQDTGLISKGQPHIVANTSKLFICPRYPSPSVFVTSSVCSSSRSILVSFFSRLAFRPPMRNHPCSPHINPQIHTTPYSGQKMRMPETMKAPACGRFCGQHEKTSQNDASSQCHTLRRARACEEPGLQRTGKRTHRQHPAEPHAVNMRRAARVDICGRSREVLRRTTQRATRTRMLRQ